MNQSKFSLADLLTVLGTVGFGFFCFLSINFLTLGDTAISIIWALLIACIVGGLALGAKLLKRASRNFKNCIIGEWVLLLLFIVSSIIAVFPFSHYFAVSAQKEEIQQKLILNISQAEGLFGAYEDYANNRLEIYNSRLHSIVAAKRINPGEYRDFGFVDGTDDNTQIENKMFTLRAQLFPSNYYEMKQVDSTWLSDAKAKITKWSPIGIVKVVNTLKTEISSWSNQLNSNSSFRAHGEEAEDFNIPLSFDNVSNKFNQSTTPTAMAILVAILFYALMLLSYFITKRHPRYPGLKVIFGSESDKDNEL